ncbi:MAG: hypothetical protein JW929_15525 [Anaerolineales bacterium]|nr:hypothetical protein [Anaerolineales bacterium]
MLRLFCRKKPPEQLRFFFLFLLLASCAAEETGNGPLQSTDVRTAVQSDGGYRATPEADQPAAGICVSFEDAMVRIEIRDWPGNVPDPRCIKVRGEQNLILANRAPEAITFTLGRYQAAIAPGESYAVAQPFGEYLLPGVHSLNIDPFGGPEIYFAAT